MWLPGDTACERLGPACPAGEFATDLPSSGVLYVSASAAAGGDGSMAAPFATITDALAAASSGTIVAVGKGTWDEAVTVPAGVTLEGACVAGTHIAPSSTASGVTGAVASGGVGIAVKDVTISGALPGLRITHAGAQVRDVAVVGATSVGLDVMGDGVLDADGVLVRGTEVSPTDGFARGIDLEDGATAMIRHVVLQSSVQVGLLAQTNSHAELRDAVISDTQQEPTTGVGAGIFLSQSSTCDAARTVIEDSSVFGFAGGDGTTFTATDTVVQNTVPGANGAGIATNGVVHTSRVRVEGAVTAGIAGTGGAAELDLTDTVVRDTHAAVGMGYGRGLDVEGNAALHVSRGWVADSADRGLFAQQDVSVDGTDLTVLRSGNTGAEISLNATIDLSRVHVEDAVGDGILLDSTRGSLEDVRVRGVRETVESGDAVSSGIAEQVGADITIHRALVERPTLSGVLLVNPGTHLTASDLVVRDVQPGRVRGQSEGVIIEPDSRAELSRILVERHRDGGILVLGTATLNDVLVRDGLGNPQSGLAGRGISVEMGGHLTAARVLLERNREIGFSVLDSGASLT